MTLWKCYDKMTLTLNYNRTEKLLQIKNSNVSLSLGNFLINIKSLII